MVTYAKFTENNDWAGETWHHWIPVEDNEAALALLQEALGNTDPTESEFHLSVTPVSEFAVDTLVERGDVGYLPDHTKLNGRLIIPPEVITAVKNHDAADWLYKGKISAYMVDPTPAQSH